MDNDLHSFFESAKTLSLTEREKLQIRNDLTNMQTSGVAFTLDPEEKAAFRNELLQAMRGSSATLHIEEEPSPSFFRLPLVFRFPLLASVVLLFFAATGSGMLLAAERSLPGDSLYPMKIFLSESMVSSFLSTPEAEAAWAMMVMERRLQEIRVKSERELTDEDDEAYAKIIEQYATNADAQVSRVTTHTAEALREEMQTTLATEERRLIRQAELRPSRHMLNTVRALREREEQRKKEKQEQMIKALHPAASSSSESSFSSDTAASGSSVTSSGL